MTKQGQELDLQALLTEIQEIQETPEGFRSGFVAVVGQPNVGKSTLMNRLIGQKVAIVSSKPQTTRRRIRGILNLDHAQVIFVDTPGIHKPFHKLGEYMNLQAWAAIPDADVVLFIADGTRTPNEFELEIVKQVQASRGPKVLVINKIDLVEQTVATARYNRYEQLGQWDRILLISALEGHGVEGVSDTLVEYLPEGPRYFAAEQATDETGQMLVAEIIREVALHHLEQEVPHALSVEIAEWKARTKGKTYIQAIIYVERKSQKGIVIGAKGKMLKQISRKARLQIEEQLGLELYLELWVKVREKWRNSESWLNRWGYKPD